MADPLDEAPGSARRLTAAARHLKRSVQAVSRSLAAVERSMGVELVRRTTRSSQATAAGAALYRRVAKALSEIEEASAEAAGGRDRPIGILRVSASTRFAPAYIVPTLAAYQEAYPEVDVELNLQDDYVDLIAGNYDVAVRIGPMPDSSLKARRLASSRRVTFAAPRYLAAHGTPSHPHDLASHNCILRTAARDAGRWPYMIDGSLEVVPVQGSFRTNSADGANQAAIEGLGIGNALYWQVRSQVEKGDVILLLAEFEPPGAPVHAIWPQSAQLPAKTRLFVDHLATRLKGEAL